MRTSSSRFRDELAAKVPQLRAFARMLVMNVERADDIVQRTLLKAWAGKRSRPRSASLGVWLFALLREEYHTQLRKRGRRRPHTGKVNGARISGLAVPPTGKFSPRMQTFCEALAQLPDHEREALVLIGASRFSCEEAAEICRCRAETIRRRVDGARRRLGRMQARMASISNEVIVLAPGPRRPEVAAGTNFTPELRPIFPEGRF